MSDPNATSGNATLNGLLPLMGTVVSALLSLIPGISATSLSRVSVLLGRIFTNWDTIRQDFTSLIPIAEDIDKELFGGGVQSGDFDATLAKTDEHMANVAARLAADAAALAASDPANPVGGTSL